MPDILVKELYMEDAEPFMHQYVVTEKGNLLVPWYDFIDPQDEEHEINCSIINDIEYYDVNDLMRHGLEEYRDTLKGMVMIMINFHRARFDQINERAEG